MKKSIKEIKKELSTYVFLEGHLSEYYNEIGPVIEYLSTIRENGEFIFDLNYLLYFLIANINHENTKIIILLRSIVGERMLCDGYIEEGLVFMQEDYAHKRYCIIKARLLLAMQKFQQALKLLNILDRCDERDRLLFICNIYLNIKIDNNSIYNDIYDMIVKVHYGVVTVNEYIEFINSRREEFFEDGVYFLLLDFSIRLKENKILNILKSYKRIYITELSRLLNEDILVIKMNINAMMQSKRLYGKLNGDIIEIF